MFGLGRGGDVVLRRHVDTRVLLRCALLDRRLIVVELLVAGERDIGRRLEELFPELVGWRLALRPAHKGLPPYLGRVPHGARVVPVLLDKREDARGYYAVGLAKVLVDLCRGSSAVCCGGCQGAMLPTLEGERDGLLELLELLRRREAAVDGGRARHGGW